MSGTDHSWESKIRAKIKNSEGLGGLEYGEVRGESGGPAAQFGAQQVLCTISAVRLYFERSEFKLKIFKEETDERLR